MFKLLLVLNRIDECAKSEFVINKRALYYILLDEIKSTVELDDFICDICFVLSSSRIDLGIQASAKGLISG